MGLDEVIASDSFLILLSANPAGYVSVLDINIYNTVAYLCRKGRARNEFMNSVTATKQIYYRNNELILPIVDNMQILKEVNITESVNRGKTVLEKTDE
jgi:cellulose biosynthesis protein BcsQ